MNQKKNKCDGIDKGCHTLLNSKVAPNCFVVGAAKAGTTALSNYLSVHPEIYTCPIKEPHYFSKDIRVSGFISAYKRKNSLFNIEQYLQSKTLERKHIAFIEKWTHYKELFREVRNEKAICEFSTGYLYSKCAAQEIYKKCPNAKIVMILRNPIDRAFSHYKMDLASGTVSESFFSEFYKDSYKKKQGWGITHLYKDLGLYGDQVERYFDVFPKSNIKIYFYENWRKDNKLILNNMAKFLEVKAFTNYANIERNISTKSPRNIFYNKLMRLRFAKELARKFLPVKLVSNMTAKAYKPINASLARSDKQRLYPFFQKDIEKLERLLGCNLDRWKIEGRSN